MDIYLPIAEVSVDVFVLLGLGGVVGFLSGVFGVGGGFLLTPLLIFIGVPPTVAVASSATQLGLHRPGAARRKLHQHNWMHGLPLKARFRRSKLYISALLPIGLGFVVGVFSAILGIGGGFILVPAMIYMLGMPTALVPGTSLLQIIFVAANVTLLQAYTNGTVDAVLALVLLVGGVIGARIGSQFGTRLRGDQLRLLLALMVLAVAAKLAFDLTVRPPDLYSIASEKE